MLVKFVRLQNIIPNFHYRIQISNKSVADCVQFYYFWKKLNIDYKLSHLNGDQHDGANAVSSQHNVSSHIEIRPHVCEMPDCSAVI